MPYIHGVDISHHNGKNAISAIEAKEKNLDFFLIKATEGKTYTDPEFMNNARAALDYGYLIGAYHFARPDTGNSPAVEAANFLVQFNKVLGSCMPCLDWEDKALKYSPEWALEWLQIVYDATGVRPVLYIQQSEVKNMKCIADSNFGLWVARWNGDFTPGNISPWNVWAIWQYTSNPYDKDYFNGTREQFIKYCNINKKVRPDDEVVNGGHTCGCSCECCK